MPTTGASIFHAPLAATLPVPLTKRSICSIRFSTKTSQSRAVAEPQESSSSQAILAAKIPGRDGITPGPANRMKGKPAFKILLHEGEGPGSDGERRGGENRRQPWVMG